MPDKDQDNITSSGATPASGSITVNSDPNYYKAATVTGVTLESGPIVNVGDVDININNTFILNNCL